MLGPYDVFLEQSVVGKGSCDPRSQNRDLHPADEDLSAGARTRGTQFFDGSEVATRHQVRSLRGLFFDRRDLDAARLAGLP
jgi:hypothetical protein